MVFRWNLIHGFRDVVALALGLTIVGVPSAAAQSNCPVDLSHLNTKLPDYNDAELDVLRDQILRTDLRAHFDNLVAQGNSPQEIAAAAIEQAAEGERAMPEADAVVRSITSPDVAERIFAELRAGTFEMNTGTTGAAGRAWALANYMMLLNREAAVAFACMARR